MSIDWNMPVTSEQEGKGKTYESTKRHGNRDQPCCLGSRGLFNARHEVGFVNGSNFTLIYMLGMFGFDVGLLLFQSHDDTDEEVGAGGGGQWSQIMIYRSLDNLAVRIEAARAEENVDIGVQVESLSIRPRP